MSFVMWPIESGASKKRKREKEEEYWNSMNSEVTIIKSGEVKKNINSR
jgi:hypothetical protein